MPLLPIPSSAIVRGGSHTDLLCFFAAWYGPEPVLVIAPEAIAIIGLVFGSQKLAFAL